MTLSPLFTVVLLLTGLAGRAQLQVKPGSKHIRYSGRVDLKNDSAIFYWPGTSATVRFKGSGIKARMRSVREPGYFYAILDGDASRALKFRTDSTLATIHLAQGLSEGEHSLEIYKVSNNTSANIFYGMEIEGQAKVLKPGKTSSRKIEFYGNSITAGHGVDVPEGGKDSGLPEFFNTYHTYAGITARHFGAQPSIIARSGIGIMISWFPEIMPEVYDRLDPFDSTNKWDFRNFRPDVVVINLFQNDYWLTNNPRHPEFKRRFGTEKPTEEFIIRSYRDFVASIRARYPRAHIICALGNMNATEEGSKWPGYIRQAIAELKDDRLHSLFFPYKKTAGHPVRKEQQAMAEALIRLIEKTMGWKGMRKE